LIVFLTKFITIRLDCITTVRAYDPDIKDRNDDQHISYFIKKDLQSLIAIDKSGCMKLKKPLDRDPPNGHSVWTVSLSYIYQINILRN